MHLNVHVVRKFNLYISSFYLPSTSSTYMFVKLLQNIMNIEPVSNHIHYKQYDILSWIGCMFQMSFLPNSCISSTYTLCVNRTTDNKKLLKLSVNNWYWNVREQSLLTTSMIYFSCNNDHLGLHTFCLVLIKLLYLIDFVACKRKQNLLWKLLLQLSSRSRIKIQ